LKLYCSTTDIGSFSAIFTSTIDREKEIAGVITKNIKKKTIKDFLKFNSENFCIINLKIRNKIITVASKTRGSRNLRGIIGSKI